MSFALTSGPAQPETQAFQPVGITDMVDLSSGDFKYNIPLMDVDGYPLNLNYQSGTGIDDEASWVGLGWNMNVGAINRQLRGVPDDALGDEIEVNHYTKPKITIGGKLRGKLEVKGKVKGEAKGKKKVISTPTVSVGIFTDNYTGIGAEIGANAGITIATLNDGEYTAGLGLGVTSSTTGGAGIDVTPSLNRSIGEKTTTKQLTNSSLSFGINSRSGTKDLTLGASYGVKEEGRKMDIEIGGSASLISYNTPPIMPSISVPYKTSFGSFSFDVGWAETVLFAGGGGTGYVNVRKIKSKDQKQINKAYGFLYAERGVNDPDVVMDFIREKDNPIIPEIPNLAMPIQLHDLFSYTSQSGSGQFRLYRGTAAFGDYETEEKANVTTGGGDLGWGISGTHLGVTLFRQDSKTTSRRWKSGNNYLQAGDFQSPSKTQSPANEAVYFKIVGEKNQEDAALNSHLIKNSALRVHLKKGARQTTAHFFEENQATGNLKKNARQMKRTVVSHLTAGQASKAGLDKQLTYYDFLSSGTDPLKTENTSLEKTRVTAIRKAHHLSEIAVTDDGGRRMVYGSPVYNTKQVEYSFAIGVENVDYNIQSGTKNQMDFKKGFNHKKGIDHYYHSESQPAYASSFLLTAILSPDYVDKGKDANVPGSDDGITHDDAGTAIKFNYSKIEGYKWRTPYGASTATVNRGLMADADDDKASIIYGEKELSYIHSIESKTKIAYFITTDRLDGLGVKDWKGEQEGGIKQKCLKEIRLYSKANLSRPIKVVKFDYDYELCPNTPNSIATGSETAKTYSPKGKLTLRRVWFEYGDTNKGKNNPYQFTYKSKTSENGNAIGYDNLSTDRWGTYKPDTQNPSFSGTLYNDLFPYSTQDPIAANANAGLWHLDQIELPTGGKIGVTYESDDYAYVQNKRAMEIQHFHSLLDENKAEIAANDAQALIKARGMKIRLGLLPPENLPISDENTWFKNNYLNGSDYLYTKLYVRLSTRHISKDYAKTKGQEYDFVPCYAKIVAVKILTVSATEKYAQVTFETISEKGVSGNPMIFAAWQKLKNEYPRYAYPGFDNRVGDNESVIYGIGRAVKAIASAVSNLGELKQSFYAKANRKKFAGKYNPNKSFIRLVKTDGKKFGGGVRVQKIQISDEWQNMTDPSIAPGGPTKYNYGQHYDYTTLYDKKPISSGVAAYEPSVGADESPLKLPIPYMQKIRGALNNYFLMEEPFGESLYPAPSIVYSKVTVTDLNDQGAPDPLLRTGLIVNEFFTAKDFPVRVERTVIDPDHHRPSAAYSFIASTSVDELALSQGYSIELNDMHGKPKATRVYNQSKSEISSTEYFFNSEKTAPEENRLKNTVDVVNADGTVSANQVLGRDVDFFTDMREQESKSLGIAVNVGLDLPGVKPFVVPVPHWPSPPNSEYKLFRSVVAVKVTQYYGIVDKVVKTENGSSIRTENIAYDGLTGEALVTKTQNEFNQDIYSVNLPAYWVYKGMGAAYQNLGMMFPNLTTNSGGQIPELYSKYVHAGDELVDLNPNATSEHYWVIETVGSKKLINKEGAVYSGNLELAKIIRSGYKNMLQPSTSSLVCLKNPIENGVFAIGSKTPLDGLKIINASTSLFDENWAAQPSKIEQTTNYVTLPYKTVYVWGDLGRINHSSGFGFKDGSTDPSQSYDYVLVHSNVAFYKGDSPTTPPDMIPSNLIKYTGTIYLRDYTQKINGGVISNESWDYPVYATSENYTEYDNFVFKNSSKIEGGFTLPFYIPSDRSLYHYHDAQSTIDYVKTVFESNDSELAYVGEFVLKNQVASTTVNNPINPYVQGYLGNWRLSESKVYQESRNNNNIFNPQKKGINIKDAGYFDGFYSYWQHAPEGWSVNTNGSKWITANTVTLYDKYGQEVENKDALGRYSAAKFDFNGELPSAVASNAMNREIYVNSFEDSGFRTANPDVFGIPEFSGFTTSMANAHTGNYSAVLPSVGEFTLSTIIHDQTHKSVLNQYLGLSTKNEYTFLSTPGLYLHGFEPSVGNKKYLLSAWVKDKHPKDKDLDLSLKINSVSQGRLKCKAVVEGWKLVEGIIDFSGFSSDLKISIVSEVAGIYIDDIRIHPFDAHMKTYAYDDKSFKLMAELDENVFATLYEYDDEGSLIRVKKETERGIMTIKESRSSYRKRQ